MNTLLLILTGWVVVLTAYVIWNGKQAGPLGYTGASGMDGPPGPMGPMGPQGPPGQCACGLYDSDGEPIPAVPAVPTTQGDVREAFDSLDEQTLDRIVFTSLGMASVCWSGRPRGVFDSLRAKEIGDALVEWVNERYIKLQPVGLLTMAEGTPEERADEIRKLIARGVDTSRACPACSIGVLDTMGDPAFEWDQCGACGYRSDGVS